MEIQELKKNISSKSQWLRVVFMALFAVIYTVVLIVAKIVIVLQILFALIASKPNANIQQLSAYLNCYIYQILNYLTYLSDKKPFPFTSWTNDVADINDDATNFQADSGGVDKSSINTPKYSAVTSEISSSDKDA